MWVMSSLIIIVNTSRTTVCVASTLKCRRNEIFFIHTNEKIEVKFTIKNIVIRHHKIFKIINSHLVKIDLESALLRPRHDLIASSNNKNQ